MAIVWLGRFSNYFEKLFNAKGAPLILDVEPAVRVVAILPSGNEDRHIQKWNRFGCIRSAAAVAAQQGAIRLRNPAGSNVLAVIEKITVFPTVTADQPFLAIQSGATDFTVFTATRLDGRLGTQAPAMITSSGTATPSTGVAFCAQAIAANGTGIDFILTHDTEIVCLPGDSITMWSNQNNLLIQGSFTWRERALEQSELT